MAVTRPLRIQPTAIIPMGDAAVLVEFADHVDLAVNAAIQQIVARIRAATVPWVRDVVPAFASLAIHFDLERLGEADTLQVVRTLIDTHGKSLTTGATVAPRQVEVPVCYGTEFALDLDAVAARTKLSAEQIATRHAAATYHVLMMGFAPGHPYLGGLDAKLAIPRRATPRPIVPAGSIAIANQQCVVYPYAISGGWNVIGRTPLRIFDAHRAEPSLFLPGDEVRFVAIDRARFDRVAAEAGTA